MKAVTPTPPGTATPRFAVARQWALVALVVAPALAYIVALVTGQGFVLGWARADTLTLRDALPLGLAYAAYLLFVFVAVVGPAADRLPGWVKWAGLIGGSVALQVAATAVVEPYPIRGIFFRQFSQVSSGYFTVGARWDNLADVLARYIQQSQTWPIHPRNQPPGLMLIFWGTTQVASLLQSVSASLASTFRPLTCFDEGLTPLSDAQVMGGVLGVAIEFIAATLAIVPLWHVVRRLSNPRSAWLAAALYPLTACMLAWVSRWDRSFVYVSIGGIALIENMLDASRTGRRGRAIGSAVALGALLAVGLFLAYKLTPVLLTLGLYALARAEQLRRADTSGWSRRWLASTAVSGLIVGATAAALWAGFVLATGFDLVTHFQSSVGFHSGMERPYWPWAAYSALDIFNHIGLPFVMVALLFGWRKWYPLALAFFGTVFVLSVFRITHDETGRLLTYLAPLGIALAAMALGEGIPILGYSQSADPAAPRARRIAQGIVALAATQLFVHLLVLRVISYGVDPLSVEPASPPASMTQTSIRFGPAGELRLVGFEMPDRLTPGQHADAVLYWRLEAERAPQTSYKVFMHVSSTLDDTDRIASVDEKPLNWALPTTCWAPGVLIRDSHPFDVDVNARPGKWLALLGLYSEETGERAKVFEAQRAIAGAVELPTTIVVK